MANRFNYGKRFGSSAISAIPKGYNAPPVNPMLAFASPAKRVFMSSKSQGIRNNKRNGISLPNTPSKQVDIDPYYEAEARMKERVEEAVKLICFGLEELSSVPPPQTAHRGYAVVNQGTLINAIRYLCDHAKIKMPELSFERKPGAIQSRGHHQCIDCGATIRDKESIEIGQCTECRDDLRLVRQLSEERREREKEIERMNRIAKQLSKTIGKVQRGIK